MDNFTTITELPNTEVTSIQLKRSFQRYLFAKSYIKGGKLIEIGCGGGQGLNLLIDVSDEILGYDIDENNIKICKKNYNDIEKITFVHNDVEKIKFKQNTIQTFLLFETIYYINDHDSFFNNLNRALKEGGKIIICTANKNWHAFNPSPFSTRYFSTRELYELGKKHHFHVEMFNSFPDKPKNIKGEIVNLVKRFAIQFGLIPKTMKAKLFFKKIFSGEMVFIPKKYDLNTTEYIPPQKIDSLDKDIYSTAIFAVFTKKEK